MGPKARQPAQSSTLMLSGAGPGAGDAELLERLHGIHEALALIPSTGCDDVHLESEHLGGRNGRTRN